MALLLTARRSTDPSAAYGVIGNAIGPRKRSLSASGGVGRLAAVTDETYLKTCIQSKPTCNQPKTIGYAHDTGYGGLRPPWGQSLLRSCLAAHSFPPPPPAYVLSALGTPITPIRLRRNVSSRLVSSRLAPAPTGPVPPSPPSRPGPSP